VIPFLVIMRREFAQRLPQVRLPEDHETIETLSFDGADKPFRIRVAVGGVVRRLDDAYPRSRQRLAKRFAPFRIAVTNQDAVALQCAIAPRASAYGRFG